MIKKKKVDSAITNLALVDQADFCNNNRARGSSPLQLSQSYNVAVELRELACTQADTEPLALLPLYRINMNAFSPLQTTPPEPVDPYQWSGDLLYRCSTAAGNGQVQL